MKAKIEITNESIETILTALENDARRLLSLSNELESKGHHTKEYKARDMWKTRIDAIAEIEKQINNTQSYPYEELR